jgi:hypothetical protein
MIGRREHVTLEASRRKTPHQIHAAARRVSDDDLGVLFLEFAFDLREGSEQAARVTDVSECVRRPPLRTCASIVQQGTERQRAGDDLQKATSMDAATVRG